jgi:HD-GYP domain-containing protein (c-di-GMP phosphodiesterase class II)
MLDDRIELAVAALVHDIGLSKVEFNLMVLKEEMKKFSISKRVKAEGHINFSVEILINKKFLVSKIIHQAILTHHEKIDGTGTPEGKTIKELKLFQLLLPIVDLIDESRTIDPGEKEKSFKETFLFIMNKYQSADTMGKLGPALSPELMKSIATYLKYQ